MEACSAVLALNTRLVQIFVQFQIALMFKDHVSPMRDCHSVDRIPFLQKSHSNRSQAVALWPERY